MSTNKESLDAKVRATLSDLQDLKDRTEDPAVHATLDRVAAVVMALGLIVWSLPEEVLDELAAGTLQAVRNAVPKVPEDVTKH